MRRLWPRGMAGQLLLLLLLALALGQVVTFWLFADERREALDDLRYQQVVDRLALVVRVLRAVPPEQQPVLIAAAAGPELVLRLGPEPELAGPPPPPARPLIDRIADQLDIAPGQVRIALGRPPVPPALLDPQRWHHDANEPDDGRHGWRHRWRAATVAVELAPGRWLEAALRPRSPTFAFAPPTLIAWAVTVLALVAVVAGTTRRITRPVRALALAADRLGRGEAMAALPERGPEEIRRATRAFNAMQARLRRFIDDRTRLLAALGHDLRTPITSLRLRAEFVEEDEVRERLLDTLDEMQRMIEATLAFARDEAASELAREVDLTALVEGVCEDLRELGRPVTFAGGPRLVARLRSLALKRALRNLVENAVIYGGQARVAAHEAEGEALVTIEDDGPGIPESELERVFEPFVRLEESRSRETGGVGLGLAIARSTVRAQGGEVTLTNRVEGGLAATVRLPLDAPSLPTRDRAT